MISPLYKNVPPIKQNPPTVSQNCSGIDLANVPPATSVADANDKFTNRAAAAIYSVSGTDLTSLSGEAYGIAILAKWTYGDYFYDYSGQSLAFRAQVLDSLRGQVPGVVGTNGDYDFLLNLYIPLVYKYWNDLPDDVQGRLGDYLLSVRGPLSKHESEVSNYPAAYVSVPETENHLFLIETARYLTNQLWYQLTYDSRYDNRRNGNGLDPPATVVWLLNALQGILQHDFAEYNARPYQDNVMMALLNLQSYAYDYDVRLAACMALDYISAKIAISSNDLRRAPPFRRHAREGTNYGPTIPGNNFLRSPLLIAKDDYPDLLPGMAFEPDPQGTWYAMLAGNTGLLPDNCAMGTASGQGNFGQAMVFAGVHDYRVPDLILDLFVSPIHRVFYQKLQHSHANGDVAVEIYAGSPSYLITAGGSPTGFCYLPVVLGITSPVGAMDDLGAVMPTTFMPTGSGLTLEIMLQFGQYTDLFAHNELVIHHLGVAPDFACGAGLFRTATLNNVDPNGFDRHGPWTFLNEGYPGQQRPGYYLAVYDGAYFGDSVAILEAYDTWLHPDLTFDQFKGNVVALFGSTRFSETGANSYTTQSGQQLEFMIAPYSQVLSSSWLTPAYAGEFAYGSVINSAQGSGVVKISNPALPGAEITLDMSDVRYPTRTSESGAVERAGWDTHTEVWVDFNAPASVPSGPDGDFYHPFKTLAEAVAMVADGGTIKMVPGTAWETGIPGNKRMRLVAPIGGVTISAP